MTEHFKSIFEKAEEVDRELAKFKSGDILPHTRIEFSLRRMDGSIWIFNGAGPREIEFDKTSNLETLFCEIDKHVEELKLTLPTNQSAQSQNKETIK